MTSARKTIEKKEPDFRQAEEEFRATDKELERRAALEESLRVEENRLKGLKAEMKSYEDRIKAVDREIELVGGDSIQRKRTEVRQASDRYAATQKEINSTKVRLRSAKKAIVQLGEESERVKKEITDA